MKQKLSLLLSLGCCALSPGIFLKPATAQVTPDGTTNTTVDVSGSNFTIQEGERAGGNLFHSFSDFSVPTGGSAFFNNAADIVNIFSRVTGGNISNIDGFLRANGSANLFLLNPAGIICGENARLDIGGSFFSTTADSFLFEDGEFSATDLDNPPLLTINAPIGLNFRDNPGDIVNQSVAQNSTGDVVGLEVTPGNNLTLVGGDINFEAGNTTARGGNIELGGLSEVGTVGINEDGSLSFPENVAKTDITLNNAAKVDVRGTGGGSITINARNLNLEAGDLGFSSIRAGITADSTSSEAQAGDITIKATDNVAVDNSLIGNQVAPEAVGSAGDVTINTGSLTLTNGGEVSATTFGQGNAGSVEITASDTITFDGENSEGFLSGATSGVARGAMGNAGNITITTGNLNLTNGGEVSAATFGQGNGGSLKITASDTITFDGEDSDGAPSDATSQVGSDAVGNAGDVTINTGNLTLTNGGQVDASTFGQGNAGSINITAIDTITFDGEQSGGFVSGATSQVGSGAVGNAGGVTINTGNLTLTNGGQVDATTIGEGNAGSVEITASDTITIDGEQSGGFVSGVSSVVNPGAVGNAGGVTINTGNLTLTNGGLVTASTNAQGNAGSVEITASDTITIDGEGSQGIPSGATSRVRSGAVGDAGGVTITTGNLNLTNRGEIDASTEGEGNAGSVEITANTFEASNGGRIVSSTSSQSPAGNIILKVKDKIILSESETGIFANTTEGSTGQGGSINIDPRTLTIRDGATISANSQGEGIGGDIELAAGFLTLDNGTISAETRSNTGGDLTLNLQDRLFLRNGSQISTTAGNQEFGGDGGNITIDTPFIVAVPRENSDITANAFEGSGGQINITAQGIFGIEERRASEENQTNDIDASITASFGRNCPIIESK